MPPKLHEKRRGKKKRKIKRRKHKLLLTCTAGCLGPLYQASKKLVPQLSGKQHRSRLLVSESRFQNICNESSNLLVQPKRVSQNYQYCVKQKRSAKGEHLQGCIWLVKPSQHLEALWIYPSPTSSLQWKTQSPFCNAFCFLRSTFAWTPLVHCLGLRLGTSDGNRSRGSFELGTGMKQGDRHSQNDLSWLYACWRLLVACRLWEGWGCLALMDCAAANTDMNWWRIYSGWISEESLRLSDNRDLGMAQGQML